MLKHKDTLPKVTILKRKSSTPLYRQLDAIMREKVQSGEWQPNEIIPSENELARLYGLSRMTARLVVTQLAQEGLLYRVRGKGTFVAEKKITAQSLSYVGIREQMEQMGHKTATRVLRIERVPISEKIAYRFGLNADEPFCSIERLRLLDGVPLSLHYTYIPSRLCPGLEKKALVDQQLCDILREDYGLTRRHVVETLESIAATEYESALLEVKKGFHLLMLKNFISGDNDIPFEFSKILFRGDKVKLRFVYER